jgi:hypothetical protein
MSFQEQSISAKTKGDAQEKLREGSLMHLAANLDALLCHRKLYIIFEKLKSITPHVHSHFKATERCGRYIE